MTITILMGDGSQAQVSDAQMAANLFAQGGEILWPNGNIYQPSVMAGGGNNPDAWLIDGISLTDYFAPPAAVPPSVSTSVVTSTGPAMAIPVTVYRLILPLSDGTYATGANYAGCSQTTSAVCDPQSFQSLQAAIQYAGVHGEVPVLVSSDAEAWAIVAGNETPAPNQILKIQPALPLPAIPAPPAAPGVIVSSSGGGILSALLSNPLALGLAAVGGYLVFGRKKGA